MLQPDECLLHGGMELFALDGRHQSLLSSLEQIEADRILQATNEAANGWLRYEEHLRGGRGGTADHHGAERFYLPKVHEFLPAGFVQSDRHHNIGLSIHPKK